MCFSSQCEENASLADCSRYLKLPFSKVNLPSNNQSLKGTKESFWITSFLCSTKLTQNGKGPGGFSQTHNRVVLDEGKGTAFSPAVLERVAALRAVRRPSEPSSFPSGDMLDLLKWRAHPERISDSLSKLRDIDGSEIVKVDAFFFFFLSPQKLLSLYERHLPCVCPQFLQDTLDTLFGILDESSQRYGLKVFDSLVSPC